MTDEEKAQILIGDDAEEFVKSELGRTILGMAEQECISAALEMQDADLTDLKKMREIQNRIWRTQRFKDWLVELITKGRETLEVSRGTEN